VGRCQAAKYAPVNLTTEKIHGSTSQSRRSLKASVWSLSMHTFNVLDEASEAWCVGRHLRLRDC